MSLARACPPSSTTSTSLGQTTASTRALAACGASSTSPTVVATRSRPLSARQRSVVWPNPDSPSTSRSWRWMLPSPTLPSVALRCRGRATSCAATKRPPSKGCTSLGQISAFSRAMSRALSASSTFATTAAMALQSKQLCNYTARLLTDQKIIAMSRLIRV